MTISLLYFEGCPHWHLADERLREALAQAGIEAAVQYRIVDSPELAKQLAFRGSPTILVDGRDPFADPSAPMGLSCRLYGTESGTEGAPSVRQLLSVLTGTQPER